jgi:hypothetical protein
VLVKQVDPGVDLYVEGRNRSLGYPRGGVASGAQLDPASGNLGTDLISRARLCAQGEQRNRARIVLERRDVSSDFIEWELIVGESRGG